MSTHFFGLKDWTYSYSHTVGRNEFAGTGFRNPVAMAIDSDDVVYVLNRSYENRPDGVRVTVCTVDEEYITAFGEDGEGDGQFTWPTAIVIDDKQNVYIADEWLNRISVFNTDGEYLSKWGMAGSGDGELNKPAGLALTADGNVLIVDSGNHRVQKFTLDGKYISQFGGLGDGPGQFNLPWGIGVDKEGMIYVADWRNDRVQQFNPNGEWQASFGQSGDGVGQFNRPSDVTVDEEGLIYVADRQNDRVQVLSPDGRFVAAMYGDSQLSPWGKEKLLSNPDMIRQRALAVANDNSAFEKTFANPCAVKIDGKGRVCILDHTRGRIQVYEKSKDPVLV